MKTDTEISQLLQSHGFERARHASIQRLRSNKLDAQAWYFLGFALFHMNRGQVAAPCFERAALLEPYGSWLSQTLPTLKNTPAGDDDRQVRELLILPETSVSACILTKNSSRTIGRCISALADAVDEVIVVDTGSSDNTVELVSNAHIPVHTFLWEDDFSTARNYAESIATSDWTVAIDSDEILNPEDRELIKTVASMFSEVRSHVVLQTIIENTTNGTVFETEPVAECSLEDAGFSGTIEFMSFHDLLNQYHYPTSYRCQFESAFYMMDMMTHWSTRAPNTSEIYRCSSGNLMTIQQTLDYFISLVESMLCSRISIQQRFIYRKLKITPFDWGITCYQRSTRH